MSKPIVLSNNKVVTPPKTNSWIWWLVFVGCLIVSCIFAQFDISALFTKLDNAIDFFGRLFNFDQQTFNYFSKIIGPMVQTLAMSFVGSILGMLLAFPFSLFCAININNNLIIWIIRSILNVVRTIPILVVAMVFKLIFGPNTFSGFFAILITTFLIATKMMYEHIETLNLASYKSALAIGMTKFQAILYTIVPNLRAYFVSTSLYMFEVNVRMATILGFVGAGGIGLLLQDQLSMNVDKAGLIIICLFVVVFFIEMMTKFLRKRLA